MVQLNPIGNILNDLPDNSAIRLGTVVEGCLITELPNSVQHGLNKVNDNRAVPRGTRREAKEEHRDTIWDKRSRGEQKRGEQRNKKSPNELNARAIQKTMINRLPARTQGTFI